MYVNMPYIAPILAQKGDRDGGIEKNGECKKDCNLPGRGRAQGGEAPGFNVGHLDGRIHSESASPVLKAPSEKGGEAMRGDGGIYPRGNVLWIAYSFRGQPFRESAHTSDEKVARKLLKA
jgi:hypothetical protein